MRKVEGEIIALDLGDTIKYSDYRQKGMFSELVITTSKYGKYKLQKGAICWYAKLLLTEKLYTLQGRYSSISVKNENL